MHVISFLLQMGFREVGVPFPLDSLNPLQANIAAHLSQLGLLAPFRLLLHCNLHACKDACTRSVQQGSRVLSSVMPQLVLL